jgi:hypothetical protein
MLDLQPKRLGLCYLACLLAACTSKSLADDSGDSFEYGGRLKLDLVGSDPGTSGGNLSKADLAFVPSAIPVAGGDRTLHLNARERRLWALLRTSLRDQPLAAHAEIDWLDTERNKRGDAELAAMQRLRHAYATHRGITVSKTYTTFTNLAAYPEINDANSPLGVTNIRHVVARFSYETRRGT